MEKILHPERFEADPNAENSTKRWQHWLKMFENFLKSIADQEPDKLKVLINFLSAEVFEFISEGSERNLIYVKTPNEVFS